MCHGQGPKDEAQKSQGHGNDKCTNDGQSGEREEEDEADDFSANQTTPETARTSSTTVVTLKK